MSELDKKAVTVQLVGGLGNQLFGYFAGRYLAEFHGARLRLDMAHFDLGITSHTSDIRSLRLEGEFVSLPLSNILKRVRDFLLVGLANRIPPTRTWAKKTMNVHVARGVGVDPDLEKVPVGMTIRGYFQTYKYVSSCLSSLNSDELTLLQPSLWFTRQVQAALANPPIMVHVRRGDYAKPENAKFGMLSAEYYSQALAKLRSELGDATPVWVFSDELEKVKLELGQVLKGDVSYINPPEGTVAAESLMLMTKGAGNIISNSTFSWWSAILNSQSTVVAPTKWFKAMEDPEDLIPGSWLRQESVWK